MSTEAPAPENPWDWIYATREMTGVGWYEPDPFNSRELVAAAIERGARSIIDVGGGASWLVDHLLDLELDRIAVLDISDAALTLARHRLGDRAERIDWIVGDASDLDDVGTFDIWHDRAAFHFLLEPAARRRYADLALRTVPDGGTAIVATFADDGPERCSGMPVQRYATRGPGGGVRRRLPPGGQPPLPASHAGGGPPAVPVLDLPPRRNRAWTEGAVTADPANYGGGRALPVHAVVEDPAADLESGLLLPLHRALLDIHDGQIVRIASPSDRLTEQLRTFEAASRHALLSVVPDPDRPGWTFHYLRKGRARTDWPAGGEREPLPTTGATSSEPFMPTRLWLYTNYDCNLACDYCCVVAGPKADPRRLSDVRIRGLVDEAVAAGMDAVFMTGGEPTLRPDLAELIAYVTDRLPLTLLTNAMLLRGPRWERIRPLIDAGRPIAFQVSLDFGDAGAPRRPPRTWRPCRCPARDPDPGRCRGTCPTRRVPARGGTRRDPAAPSPGRRVRDPARRSHLPPDRPAWSRLRGRADPAPGPRTRADLRRAGLVLAPALQRCRHAARSAAGCSDGRGPGRGP